MCVTCFGWNTTVKNSQTAPFSTMYLQLRSKQLTLGAQVVSWCAILLKLVSQCHTILAGYHDAACCEAVETKKLKQSYSLISVCGANLNDSESCLFRLEQPQTKRQSWVLDLVTSGSQINTRQQRTNRYVWSPHRYMRKEREQPTDYTKHGKCRQTVVHK